MENLVYFIWFFQPLPLKQISVEYRCGSKPDITLVPCSIPVLLFWLQQKYELSITGRDFQTVSSFLNPWVHLYVGIVLSVEYFYSLSDIIIYIQTFYTSECMACLRVIEVQLWGDSNSSSLNCLLGAKSNRFPSGLTKAVFLLALNTWLSLLFITKIMSLWETFNVVKIRKWLFLMIFINVVITIFVGCYTVWSQNSHTYSWS